MKFLVFFPILLASAALSGCASLGGTRLSGIETRVRDASDLTLAGRVSEVTAAALVLRSHDRYAESVRFDLAPGLPVFDEDGVLRGGMPAPGTEVVVYYKANGDKSYLVGIRILSVSEARRLLECG